MKSLFARFTSFMFNPLFVLFPVPYLLINRFHDDVWYSFKWTFFTLFFLFIIGSFMLYEVHEKVFTNLDVSNRKQRPLLFGFLTFVIGIYVLSLVILRGPAVLFTTTIGVMIGILCISLVNRRVKASIHIATLTTVLLTFFILYGISPLWFLLIPLVAWSRLYLKRHTLSEIFAGGGVGALLTFIMYLLVKYLFHGIIII